MSSKVLGVCMARETLENLGVSLAKKTDQKDRYCTGNFLAPWYHLFRNHYTSNSKTIIGTEQKHDSHRRDKILHFFLRLEVGQSSPLFWSDFLTDLHSQPRETGKNPLSAPAKRGR